MKRHIMLCVLGGCAMLLVLGQPAAAVTYDFDALNNGKIGGQDGWTSSANYTVYSTAVTGNRSLPANDKYVSQYGGTATDSGYRPNDGNWSFDLTGVTKFAIQNAMSIDYVVGGYYGNVEYKIQNTVSGKGIGFGIKVLPWYYAQYIERANGGEVAGGSPRPTAVDQVWDFRMEVDTTANLLEGSGALYVRRRDTGQTAWQVVSGLENVGLWLDSTSANIQAANQIYGEVDVRIAHQDNMAVVVPGSLTLRSFLDKDLNGVRDGSDEDLPGVVYSVTGPYSPIVSQSTPTVQWAYPNFGGTTNGIGSHSVLTGSDATWGADDGSYTAGDARPQYYYRQGAASRVLTVAPGTAVVESFGYRPELGDANVDGVVDISDFFILKTYFDQDPSVWAEGNFNEDTLVDISDFFILKGNFDAQHPDYTPPGGAGAPTPEPATVSLLAVAGIGLLLKRRRR